MGGSSIPRAAMSMPAAAPTIELMAQVKESIHFGPDTHNPGSQLVLLGGSHRRAQFCITEKEEEDEHQDQRDQNGPEVNLADD